MRYKFVKGENAETYTAAGGEKTVFLATGEDTENRVSIYDSKLLKGNGAPWHYHEIDDEIFYVISGSVEFGILEETVIANSGDMVIAGPFVRRKFRALEDSHLVVVNAPGGPSEGFLREIVNIAGMPSEQDKKRFIEKYGIHVLDIED